jgi:hypothetical protein
MATGTLVTGKWGVVPGALLVLDFVTPMLKVHRMSGFMCAIVIVRVCVCVRVRS